MPIEAESGNEFHAKVPAGSYVLRADVTTPQGSFRGEAPVNVQSDLAGVTLAVAPSAPLPVELITERTRGTSLGAPGHGANAVYLRFLGEPARLPSPEFIFTVGPGANNNVNGVDPGVYAVEISPNRADDFYVDRAQCGGIDLLREDLTLGRGVDSPIRIALRDDGGRLSGNVVSDGDDAPRATVLVIPDQAPKQIKQIPSVISRGKGQFQSPMLAPGDYTVLAFDNVAGIEYTNPEIMNVYSANATHVSVTANSESRVNVNLIRTQK